jgi:hypothetical protein
MAQRENTTGAVGTALDSGSVNWAYIIRLDVVDDPLFAWTGFGDLVFTAGQTGDTALDGFTFQGITHLIAEVGAVQDGQGGSGALEITMPGVDLTDELMRQIVFDRRRWQFLPGRVWIALLDDNGNLIGKPIRMRSGHMDKMPVTEDDEGKGTIQCIIESQQAYATQALNTRYSEQKEIDSNDNSQDWVWQLANMTPALGQPNSLAGSGGSVVAPPSNGPSGGKFNFNSGTGFL